MESYLRVVFLLEVLFAVFLAGLRVVLFFVVFFLFIAKAESTSFTGEKVDAPFSSVAGDQPAMGEAREAGESSSSRPAMMIDVGITKNPARAGPLRA